MTRHETVIARIVVGLYFAVLFLSFMAAPQAERISRLQERIMILESKVAT